MKHFRLLIDDPGDVWWVDSPVPKPSIPGISSPKLQRKKPVRYHRFWCIWTLTQKNGLPLDPLLRGLALELTRLPLLELGGSFTWGGWAPADTGG